jgi:DNA topoisomerase-1
MRMKLLIIESPGKQKTIQKYIGSEWKVLATLGHIRGLVQNLEFITHDFEPKYEYLTTKLKAIKQIKDIAKDAEDVYIGSDKDYEGEQIALSVCLLLKLNPKTVKRITFTEVTEKSIKKAIENPGRINMNRVNTQQCRAMLDLLIGFTMSPLLWKYVAPSLSAGRCQTPALRLIVERENEITNFKASLSWRLKSMWKSVTGYSFSGVLEDELEDEDSAINYMENIHNITDATIISKEIGNWCEKSPLPLITSTLQQQASALYTINPKETMRIAQRLYEAGHITYMRTDKAIISDDAKNEAIKWVIEEYGDDYVNNESNINQNKKTKKADKTEKKIIESNAQEAHEAIRPTNICNVTIEGEWSVYDKKIYKLIWQRTVQSVMSSVRGETCKIRVQIDGDDDFNWLSECKRTLFDGWRRIGKVEKLDDETDDEIDDTKDDNWINMMNNNIGDKIKWDSIKAEPKETRNSSRFTEATLVRELEKFGIGRPSTYASLIYVIQEKNYVELKTIPSKEVDVKEYNLKPNAWPVEIKEFKKKTAHEKDKLVPTELGRSVLSFMLKHFDDLFDYRFTSYMEKRLDKIAEGEEEWKQTVKDMWFSYKERYEKLYVRKNIENSSENTISNNNPKIKEFSDGLKAVMSKKGPLLLIEGEKKTDTQFLGWPTNISFEEMTEEIAKQFVETVKNKSTGEEIGEWNGIKILKKSGKFGEYLQCNDICIPYQVEELDKTIERLEAKKNGSNTIIKQFKDYVVRIGQYGPYIMKTSLKRPNFISIPKDINVSELGEKDIDALYRAGLESKRKWNNKK